MPLYEYICKCGGTFDKVMPIGRRYDVMCSCGDKPQIKIGLVSYRMAEPFSVLAHDGTVLHQTQTIEKTPPLGYRHDNHNLAEA